jgi:hypothetical protein
MVMPRNKQPVHHRHGFLSTELMVAMAIVIIALLPMMTMRLHETRMARACYQRAVAMEIVDGEMELLLAGEWKSFAAGTNDYPLSVGLQDHLPPGTLTLAVAAGELRLQWTPADPRQGGAVVRTGRIP